ncbi:glyoxalase bleomycin resistance protein dioxygenase superfamily [Stagonosporopsis vannaccii]|nr:glyoxalase bleomycin resistance protein dioxygenase superfamily [Stagonosporopsis vannaccii]
MAPTQALDHLILFLPVDPSTSFPKLPPFFEKNFTLTPGGVHADGLTSNILILLADGCYIELISFISPTKDVSTHWWASGAQKSGWMDWCLTNGLSAKESWEAISGPEGSHAVPVEGGRKRADGVDVKWAVTFPKGDNGGQASRGRVPFFCHDVTERRVRVPLSGEKTAHASGVLGVRELTVVVRDEGLLGETAGVYARLFGQEGARRANEVVFQTSRVEDVKALDEGAKVVLRLPKDGDEAKRLEETGYWYGDVVLAAPAPQGKAAGTRERLDAGDESVSGLYVEYI